jgi:cytochrome c556
MVFSLAGDAQMWSLENVGRCQKTTASVWIRSFAIITTAAVLSGCGGRAAPKPAAVEPTTASRSPKKAAEPQVADTKNDLASTSPTGRTGRTSASGIPYDAFFDNPLAVAEDKTAIGGNAAPEKPVMNDKPESEPAKPATGTGELAWSEFIPIDNLQDEVKKIRNRLTGWLQGQGTYNGNYKDIAVDGTVLAALAEIAVEHSGDVSWKANAPFIRKFGHELAGAASGLGSSNFEKSKVAFEKITAVFNGSIPADAGEAAPKQPFHEVADRGGLMKRVEKAKNWMKDNINTEAKLKGDADTVLHEAYLIATLGKVFATEGYSNTDEDDYRQSAKVLIDGALETVTATKDQSFDKFTKSMDKVNKSCDQCHVSYRNG